MQLAPWARSGICFLSLSLSLSLAWVSLGFANPDLRPDWIPADLHFSKDGALIWGLDQRGRKIQIDPKTGRWDWFGDDPGASPEVLTNLKIFADGTALGLYRGHRVLLWKGASIPTRGPELEAATRLQRDHGLSWFVAAREGQEIFALDTKRELILFYEGQELWMERRTGPEIFRRPTYEPSYSRAGSQAGSPGGSGGSRGARKKAPEEIALLAFNEKGDPGIASTGGHVRDLDSIGYGFRFPGSPTALAVSEDNLWLAVAMGQDIHLLKAISTDNESFFRKVHARYRLESKVESLKFFPQTSDLLAAGEALPLTRIRVSAQGEMLPLAPAGVGLRALAISPDEARILTHDPPWGISIRDARTGAVLSTIFEPQAKALPWPPARGPVPWLPPEPPKASKSWMTGP